MPDPSLALLADESVFRKQPMQPRRDQALDLAVDLGEVVLRPLEADRERAPIDEAPLRDFASLARQRASDA